MGTVFCCYWVAGRIPAFPVNWASVPSLTAVLFAGAGDWDIVSWFRFGSPVGTTAFGPVFAVSTGIIYAFSFVSGFCFCSCWVRSKLFIISLISVLVLVVFCCWPFTVIF